MQKLAFFVACVLGSEAVVAPGFTGPMAAIPNQYIVKLKENKLSSLGVSTESFITAQGMTALSTYSAVFNGFAAELTDEQFSKLSEDPLVEYVEPNGVVSAAETWGLDRIDAAKGLDDSYQPPNRGTGVHVFVLDTGVQYSIPDFEGRTGVGADFSGDRIGSYDRDCHGHGTHCAGTVGSKTWGVAKDVTIHGVRVLACNGSGTNEGVVAGINWVVQQTRNDPSLRPAVISMSLGGSYSQAINDAVRAAYNSGVTVVVAAGNSGLDASYFSPASEPTAITVGASDYTDTMASFSNFGKVVDIFAPGVKVESLKPNGFSTAWSGTSMATPHVAGAAAIYLSANRNATPQQVADALIAKSTRGILKRVSQETPNTLLRVTYLAGDNPPPSTTSTTTRGGGGGGGTTSTTTRNGGGATCRDVQCPKKYFPIANWPKTCGPSGCQVEDCCWATEGTNSRGIVELQAKSKNICEPGVNYGVNDPSNLSIWVKPPCFGALTYGEWDGNKITRTNVECKSEYPEGQICEVKKNQAFQSTVVSERFTYSEVVPVNMEVMYGPLTLDQIKSLMELLKQADNLKKLIEEVREQIFGNVSELLPESLEVDVSAGVASLVFNVKGKIAISDELKKQLNLATGSGLESSISELNLLSVMGLKGGIEGMNAESSTILSQYPSSFETVSVKTGDDNVYNRDVQIALLVLLCVVSAVVLPLFGFFFYRFGKSGSFCCCHRRSQETNNKIEGDIEGGDVVKMQSEVYPTECEEEWDDYYQQ